MRRGIAMPGVRREDAPELIPAEWTAIAAKAAIP